MTAGQLGANRLDTPHRGARPSRPTAIVSFLAILGVAVAITVTVLVTTGGPQAPAVPAAVPTVAAPAPAVPAAVPTVAAPAPTLALPSVFGPVRQDRLPNQGGPGLRCPGTLRGPCAY